MKFGSLYRNFTRILAVSTILFWGSISAEDSQWKYKIHKSLVKEVLNKNYKIAFDHIGEKIEKSNYLTEVKATIEDLRMTIAPGHRDWG